MANTGGIADAIRYAIMSSADQGEARNLPAPPPTPPGLTPEQHAAHLAIHDLVSAEEFEVLREEPGFVQLSAYWGAIGPRKFCCEVATKAWPLGQHGYVGGMVWHSSMQLNEHWMAQMETAQPVRRSAWESLKNWLKR